MRKELVVDQVAPNFNARITFWRSLYGYVIVDKHSELEKMIVPPTMFGQTRA
jgi:hypothetical protein